MLWQCAHHANIPTGGAPCKQPSAAMQSTKQRAALSLQILAARHRQPSDPQTPSSCTSLQRLPSGYGVRACTMCKWKHADLLVQSSCAQCWSIQAQRWRRSCKWQRRTALQPVRHGGSMPAPSDATTAATIAQRRRLHATPPMSTPPPPSDIGM